MLQKFKLHRGVVFNKQINRGALSVIHLILFGRFFTSAPFQMSTNSPAAKDAESHPWLLHGSASQQSSRHIVCTL